MGKQPREIQKIANTERRPPRRDRHEWIWWLDISPQCRNPARLTVVVGEINAALAPVVLMIHKPEFTAQKRMKRVSHPKGLVRQIATARS